MTAILVFSSPSLVPLRAAFISCWTWLEDTRQRRSDEEEDMGEMKEEKEEEQGEKVEEKEEKKRGENRGGVEKER